MKNKIILTGLFILIWVGFAWAGPQVSQNGGDGSGDMTKAVYDSNDNGVVDTVDSGTTQITSSTTGYVAVYTAPSVIGGSNTPALGTPASGVVTNLTGTASGVSVGYATTAGTANAAASQVITDNAIVTVDDSDSASGDIAYFTANGLAGYDEAEFKSAYNMEAGTDYQAYSAILADFAALSGTTGDLAYFDGTDWVVLDSGTSGYWLLAQGALAPIWSNEFSGVTIGGGTASTIATWDASGNLVSNTALGDLGTDGTINDDSVQQDDIESIDFEIVFDATYLATQDVDCSGATTAQLNSGPYVSYLLFTDADTSTLYFSFASPLEWNAGTLTFTVIGYDTNASPGDDLQMDVCAFAVGDSDAVSAAWGSEVAIDIDLSSGYAQYDTFVETSGAVTVGNTPAAGDMIHCRIQVDATGTDATVGGLWIHQIRVNGTKNPS